MGGSCWRSILSCEREVCNAYDCYALAVKITGTAIARHIPTSLDTFIVFSLQKILCKFIFVLVEAHENILTTKFFQFTVFEVQQSTGTITNVPLLLITEYPQRNIHELLGTFDFKNLSRATEMNCDVGQQLVFPCICHA